MPRQQGYYGPRDPGKDLTPLPVKPAVNWHPPKPYNPDDRLDRKRIGIANDHLKQHQKMVRLWDEK